MGLWNLLKAPLEKTIPCAFVELLLLQYFLELQKRFCSELWITVLILSMVVNVVTLLHVHGYLPCAYARRNTLLEARVTGTSPGDSQVELNLSNICLPLLRFSCSIGFEVFFMDFF